MMKTGFITLYFAKMLETADDPINIVVVCTTGVGISELLRAKITKSFSDIQVQAVLSVREFYQTEDQLDDIDLVVSTIPLNPSGGKPYLLISGMFSAEDKDRLEKRVRALKNG